MISVIIPTYKNSDYLNLALSSSLSNSILLETEIIVIVDGYIEESRAILDKYKHNPKLKIIELEENMGMAYAINLGVFASNNKYSFIVNDDNIFPSNYDSRILEEMNKAEQLKGDKTVLTVNQVERNPSMYNFPIANFGDLDNFRYSEWLAYEKNIAMDKFTNDARIFPFVIPKRWLMAVGCFDSAIYSSAQIVDYDLMVKLEILNFEFLRTLNIHLFHWVSTATKNGPEREKFIQKEQIATQEFIYKWGVMPTNGINNTKIPKNKQFRGFVI